MTPLEWNVLVVLIAVAIDLLFGEPPNRLHPVAWMGLLIGLLKRKCPVESWFPCLLWGIGIVAIGVAGLGFLGYVIESISQPSTMPQAFGGKANTFAFFGSLAVNACLLKCCFGIRSLEKAANTVYQALKAGDLGEAKRCLSYHLVSRDVQQLDATQVSAATIESVAENTSDSVVAPLFFYFLAGLPGALIYRYVNTCDAMLGYRTDRLQWLGKFSARTDDVLNLVPARFTVALMMLSSLLSPGRVAEAIRIWWTDSGRTSSPNAGHPMSAAAGLLGVRLEKEGQYVLGSDLAEPSVDDIAAMNSLFRRTVFAAVAVAAVACLVTGRLYF
ncbi:MAG: adenosylcobinamide-phosphate synthase CbiB [Planctomycetota bacterium]